MLHAISLVTTQTNRHKAVSRSVDPRRQLPITGLTSELSESLRHLLVLLRRHVFAQHLDQLAGRLQVNFNVRQLGQQSLGGVMFYP